jgi:hypothetical protein
VAAVNKYGVGPFPADDSIAMTALAADRPGAVAAPTTTKETIYVRIAWTAAVANHIAVDAYQIMVADSVGTFVDVSAPPLNACTSSTVVDFQHCLIPMTSFWGAPLNLPQEAIVRAQIRAHNVRGWSEDEGTAASNTEGATIETVPRQMAAPTRGTDTTDTVLHIDWAASTGLDTGGSDIVGYAVYSDDGVPGAAWPDEWKHEAGYTALHESTFLKITEGVKAAAIYTFRVMAKNKWGWGAFSTTDGGAGRVLAATHPSQVGLTTTAIDPATGGVLISWEAPLATGGVQITAYRVEVQGLAASSIVWNTEAACDGEAAGTAGDAIRSSRSCIIPMADLVRPTPGPALAFDALVQVRVSAANEGLGIGEFGPTSDVNTVGARIRQAPG